MTQPPVIMVDNVFDNITLYPTAVITSSGALGGMESPLSDYRRERTYWQAATSADNRYVRSDLGASTTAIVDFCWIDRGHNLWDKNISVESGSDGVAFPDNTFRTVPAFGTVGGDPTTIWCVTEEGAIYTFFPASSARRYHQVRIAQVWQPIITGVIMGKRVQLASPAGWSSVLDEDAGERSERREASLVPGYDGEDRTYSARKVELRLAYIGASDYDSTIRGLRRTLWDVNQPAVVCMNYGLKPERAWLYKYRGKDWSSPTKGVTRSVNIPMFEYGPLIR